ncbi:MAG: hypothetical protein WD768_13095 [Phycisphaeraceae bacterium]
MKRTNSILILLLASSFAHADGPLVAKPITGTALLKPPADIAAKAGSNFTIAKAAPSLDIVVIDNLPDKGKQTLWSTWGDGCVHSNGKYYTSIGDHMGVDSTSHLYEYDPQTKKLTLIVDVLRDLKIPAGIYGHGKVHSGIHEAADGSIYFSTYWGKHREVDAHFGKSFEGSVVLRYDPKSKKLEDLGAIVPRQGLPASHFDAERGLLYFYAVYKSDLCVYDVNKRQRLFLGGGDIIAGSRAMMRDAKGRLYFTGKDDVLHYYDPATNALAATKVGLPESQGAKSKGDTLRAAISRPTKKGLIYGMTASGQVFEFNPGAGGAASSGPAAAPAVRDLGPNFGTGGYTAAMAISPDDRFLYFVPGAHGSSGSVGSPVVQIEIATGKRKVLAFLSQPLKDKLGYYTGGTYNLQIDANGESLYMTFNGQSAESAAKKAIGFGLPSVMVLHIPASER